MEIDKNKIFHVLPIDDDRPHTEFCLFREGQLPVCECDCKPEHEEIYPNGMVIIHNSFDGREGVEWVKEYLSK